MNTPRKKRRWNSEIVSPLWTSKNGPAASMCGLYNEDGAVLFAALVSEFVFLEQAMELVMSRLLGAENNAAGHVCRTILSPAVRVDMMRALLERAPRNAEKSEIYDEIISEFSAVGAKRNQYVHGKWQTCSTTLDLYLVRPADDPYGLDLLVAEKFDLEEMVDIRRRIHALTIRVYLEVGDDQRPEHPK